LKKNFQIDPSHLKSFDYYKQAKAIYTRTNIVLGEMPIFWISDADSKEVRVKNDRQWRNNRWRIIIMGIGRDLGFI